MLRVARFAFSAWARRRVSACPDHGGTRRSRRIYGAPRVHAELRAAGVRCARKRVVRLMLAAGLVGCHRRRRTRTTVAESAHTPAPNLVARDFQATAPDRLWIGDIMYVATAEGWLYLAVLVDVYSRRVIGWAMADHLRTELALDALRLALCVRRPGAGLVHHTDWGRQYTASSDRAALAARGVTASMGRAGACLDNAMAESFFATLKAELVDTTTWPTRDAARLAIFEWIEVWYHRQRRHAALAYRAPVALEECLMLLVQDLPA